jgi:threonine/homoserine/homoserine lactone efflux protein
MAAQLFLALVLFVAVASFTPGPNNIMVMTSGVNFGFGRTWPHILGIAIGFTVMVLIVGIGLGVIFDLVPWLYTVLKYVSVAYLLYLAWIIANAGPLEEADSQARPLTFLEAAAFQWVNPKGWIMAVGAIASYASILGFPYNIVLIAGLFGVASCFSVMAWAGLGAGMRRFLRSPRAVRVFNIVMALLLVASVIPVLFEG